MDASTPAGAHADAADPSPVVSLPPTASAPAPATELILRPRQASDDDDIRRILRTTLQLGQPLGVDAGDLAGYESLCLDWYLERGQVIVAVEAGRVRGYLLACLDQPAYERWARRRAVRWGAAAVGEIAIGRRRADARRFVWLRIRDGLTAWRHAPRAVLPAHAHFNLDGDVRGAGTGHRLAAAMDELVDRAGLPGWYGELNVPAGVALTAIERAGARVVYRQSNRTLSWLSGVPVERATIARLLDDRTGVLRR